MSVKKNAKPVVRAEEVVVINNNFPFFFVSSLTFLKS